MKYSVRGATCQGCLIEPATVVHHVNGVHDDNRRVNVALLCEPCHRLAHHPHECPAGHPYDERNTYVDPRGHRRCRRCRYMNKQGYPDRMPAWVAILLREQGLL